MSEIVVRDLDTARAVMEWSGAAPPALHGAGPTVELRAAMARFADSTLHAPRRASVESAVAHTDVEVLMEVARTTTRALLGEPSIDAVVLAREVPTLALAAALGLVRVEVADVEAIAAVIGRGATVTAAADAATERLLAMAAPHASGAVAAVSLLYQCLDATAALVLTTLHAAASGAARVPAVPRTRRIAMTGRTFCALTVVPGDELVVELGEVGLEFGAGPHQCPGRAIAEAIVATMCDEVTAAGYEVDLGTVTTDADGRPGSMSLARARGGRGMPDSSA